MDSRGRSDAIQEQPTGKGRRRRSRSSGGGWGQQRPFSGRTGRAEHICTSGYPTDLRLVPFNGAAGGQEEEDGAREEGTICPEGGGCGGGGRIMVGKEIKLRSGSEVLCEKTGTVMKSKGRTRAAATGGGGGGGGGRRAESELIACSVEHSYVKEWEVSSEIYIKKKNIFTPFFQC